MLRQQCNHTHEHACMHAGRRAHAHMPKRLQEEEGSPCNRTFPKRLKIQQARTCTLASPHVLTRARARTGT
eukprot:5644917-Pleurochrysis_carterae.AAC.2